MATDHGIFTGDTYYSYLEYSPSSNATSLNEILFVSALTGYAVGNNGIILTTSDTGQPLKPYCNISTGGGCKGSTVSFNGFTGSSTNYQWYIDSVPVSNYANYSQVFSTTGMYHATLRVWNQTSALDDTSYATFYIVDTPQINLPVTLADSILCHAQPISLQINTSQADVTYSLFRNGNSTAFGTVPGTGGSVNLITAPVDTAGVYHLRSSSTLAPACAINFTDTFFVDDQHTTALFHPGFINSAIGEPVQFYSRSLEAQQFHWTFSNGTQSISSNVENPSGIIFTDTGYVNVLLIAISTNGCADTVIDSGNYVAVEPAYDDTCWANYTDGIDPTWQGFSPPPAIKCAVPTIDGGFLVAGGYDRHILRTRFGVHFGRTANAGGYLAKYSKNGMLKWIDYSYGHYYSAGSTFASSPAIPAIDALGNIFMSDGLAGSGTGIIFNNGDTIQYNNIQGNVIAKLDSTGVPVWRTILTGGNIYKIVFDKSGNLVVAGYIYNFTSSLKYIFNGVVTDSLTISSMADTKEFIMRLDSSGHCLWMTLIENNFTNYAGINDFTVDDLNNICVAGTFERDATFFSTNNSTTTITNNGWTQYGGKMYLIKYDPNGVITWKMSAGCSAFADGTSPFAITTDVNRDIYVSGINPIDTSNGITMTCINSDSTTHVITVGGYFLLKINSSGHFAWVAGLDGSGSGYVYAITLHNDKIYAAGNIFTGTASWTGSYISSNGATTPYNLNGFDFFVARYDTTGILEQLSNSATNVQSTRSLSPLTISINNADKLFMAGVSGFVNSMDSPVLFGDSLFFYGEDGFYAKTDLEICGNSIYVSSANNIFGNHKLSLYPNPSHDFINISSDKDESIREVVVYDVCGKELTRKKQSQHSAYTLDVKNLPPGMLLVKIIFEDGEIVKRVMKM